MEDYNGACVFINGNVERDICGHFIKGYWEYKGGAEGGELYIWANTDDNLLEVDDFDGAYDLPSYVKKELSDNLNVICDW